MHTKDLIKLNNEKRSLLTKENEKYYSQMLSYVRTHFFLSEQHAEEILLELLDHLLEAQNNGKTAKEVFGDDLKAYCDELIRQLPNERRSSYFTFTGFLIMNLAGISITIAGLAIILKHLSTGVEPTFYIGTAIVSFFIQVCFIFFGIYVVLSWLKRSAFTESSNYLKDLLFLFFLFFVIGVCIIFIPKLIPSFGAQFSMNGYIVLLIGVIVWFSSEQMNKKFGLK